MSEATRRDIKGYTVTETLWAIVRSDGEVSICGTEVSADKLIAVWSDRVGTNRGLDKMRELGFKLARVKVTTEVVQVLE